MMSTWTEITSRDLRTMEDSEETDRDLSTVNHHFRKRSKSDNWFMMCKRFLSMTEHIQPRARDPANINRMTSREEKIRSSTKYKVPNIHIYASSRGLLRHWEATYSKITKVHKCLTMSKNRAEAYFKANT